MKKSGVDLREVTATAAAQEVIKVDATETKIVEVFAVSGISKEKTLEITKKLCMRKPVPCLLGCNQPHPGPMCPYTC